MNGGAPTTPGEPHESHRLVEHFFRHESANLVSVLTRAFGFGRIDLVEDMVQAAMIEAMHAWRQRGVPANAAGWIHRVARNRILDALRREKVHDQAIAFAGQTIEASNSLVDEWLEAEQIPDSLLRMMFVCCHPTLDRPAQVALCLKLLCGFSVGEIARGLLAKEETVKKKIQRAKKSLAELKISLDVPTGEEIEKRMSTIHDVLYLMFNEGYSTSNGIEPIRFDICEEAARLCHLLCEHETFSTPKTRALLSLMLFHASRLESRIDDNGSVILLEDQDRSTWNSDLIGAGEEWLARSNDAQPSRFHLEAAIARQHCRAASVAETNWAHIVALYDRLLMITSSPIYLLNRAIAVGQTGDTQTAITEIEALRDEKQMSDYYLLDCALARLFTQSGELEKAKEHYEAALAAGVAAHERALIEKKLQQLGDGNDC